MKITGALLALFILIAACNGPEQSKFRSHGKVDYPVTPEDELLLDSIQYQTFQFFYNEVNKDLGLFKDRAKEGAPSSIASTGFALPTYAIAAERGWISREEAAEVTYNSLHFLLNSEQSTDPFATGYKGFYYHFVDMETGKRTWESELSSIDTGLLIMGVIFARNYYNLNNETEISIRSMAAQLIERLDWSIFYMP